MTTEKVQHCIRCDCLTGKCEEDKITCDECGVSPLCEECWNSHLHNFENPFRREGIVCTCYTMTMPPCNFCVKSWEQL